MMRFGSIFLLVYLCTIQVQGQKNTTTLERDTVFINTCLKQGQRYFVQLRLDSLLYFTQRGLVLAQKRNLTQYLNDLYRHYGHYYWRKVKLDSAEVMYKKSQYWAQKHQDKADIELNGYCLALLYYSKLSLLKTKSNQTLLVRQLYENLRYSMQSKSEVHLAKNQTLIATLFANYGNDSLYHYYSEKAIKSLQKEQKPTLRLAYLCLSTNLHLYKNKTLQALAYYQKLVGYSLKHEALPVYDNYLVEIMRSAVKYQNWELGTLVGKQIQLECEARLNSNDKVLFYACWGAIYAHYEQYKKAAQAHQKALRSSSKLSIPLNTELLLLDTEQKIAEYNLGYKKALLLQKRLFKIKDSLRVVYTNFDLIAIQERLTSEAKEYSYQQQIRIKQLENVRKSEQTNQQFWMFVLSTVFLLSIITVVVFKNSKIQKQAYLLHQLNENKTRILSIIGHDLRSPLIATYNSLRQTSNLITQPTLQKQLPRLNNLLLLVDNLLYWSHSQQETLQANQQRVVVSDIIEEVIELLDANIEAKQQTVINQVNKLAVVKADYNHLRIIFRNIIQNAVKFTPTNGIVTIDSREEPDGQVKVIVKDTGIGFEQSRTDISEKGTLLGLKLIQDLTKANNGEVDIQSLEYGGTAVSVLFKNV